MDITQDDITGLGRKLRTLDLTEGERALLEKMMGADPDDEVGGFAMNDPFAGYSVIATRSAGSHGFAESGKKADAPYGFAESGKKADSL